MTDGGALRHLGLNAVFLVPGTMGGVETYTHQLIAGLARARPGLRITVLVNPGARPSLEAAPWADAVRLVTHPLLSVPGTRAIAEFSVVPLLAGRLRVDLLHSLGMLSPAAMRAASVATIGDAIWHHHPETLDRATALIWKRAIPLGVRRAERVITFTQASRTELTRVLALDARKIDVIAPGGGTEKVVDPMPEHEVRAQYDLGDSPVVLTVSAKRAHKNLLVLVRAMRRLLETQPDAVLVLPGNHTEYESSVLEPAARDLGVSDRIRFTGHAPPGELEALYRTATVFAFPSLMEGFGLPVLEAMHRGLPVVASRIAAVVEVAGDAARYFDPHNPDDLAHVLTELLAAGSLRQELASRGRERQAAFGVERTVEQTLETYERALTSARRSRRS